jgi:uncharacterized membrane protein YfcA
VLALTFFLTALLYSTVGFGGGSSYMAILAVASIPYLMIPKIGLICNLIVVSSGCWHYYRSGHFNKKLVLPFVLSSVPMAFVGGMFPIDEKTFMMLLGVTLFFGGLRLFFVAKPKEGEMRYPSQFMSSITGAILGLLSGLVALGGGIFLSPLMMNLKWGRPKEVAATASTFIFLNSAAGLVGQLTKGLPSDIFQYWPLFLAVFLGGQVGSRLGTHSKVSQHWVQKGTAILILVVSYRIIGKLI